jgi:hypothetical protein
VGLTPPGRAAPAGASSSATIEIIQFPCETPRGGDFWIFKIGFGPCSKNLSKNGLPQKGVSLSAEGVFAKKFSGAGEDSL